MRDDRDYALDLSGLFGFGAGVVFILSPFLVLLLL